jgi:hypothetical protein
LKQFDLFGTLSDTYLTSLSYSMHEDVYLRGQDVYQEGIDYVDKIYLIKNGEFELTKKLLKPIPKTSDSFLYRPASRAKEVAPESAVVEFSYRRFK